MPYAVLPALIPDIPKVYEMYFAAFKGERMGELMLEVLFPEGTSSPEFRKAHAEGTLAYWHQNDFQYTFKCVDMDTAEIVGMGLGDIYMRERSEEERKFQSVPWLSGAQLERAEAVLRPLHDIREKLFGGRKYIYSHVMGVDPKHQGRGAGLAVLKLAFSLSEQTGLPLYFEASPTIVKMYEKFGCERLSEKIVHKAETLGLDEDIEVPLMVRMPSIAKGMTFAEWRERGYPKFE
ncbi:hypothetical protein OQA88_6105 [Cercophora sp. LCS_1]